MNKSDRSELILIVEDNRTQAEFLRYHLLKEGYEVITANNGRDALFKLKTIHPLIILTDVMMPEMDGYCLCAEIKSSPELSDIPVILVTHLFSPADVIKGLEAGADNFVIKPYTPDVIISRISSTLQSEYHSKSKLKSDPLDIVFSDQIFTITSTRQQIINILLSTYETAVKNNADLQVVKEELQLSNDQKEKMLDKLSKNNIRLSKEIHEKEIIETALGNANKKLKLMADITRHDLLNQLNALNGYLELAVIDKDDPSLSFGYLEKAMQSLQMTINTVKFTKEYQDIGINSPVWQNFKEIISRSLRHTSLGNIRLIEIIPPDLEIYADPLIEKVFANLIENAVRYGDTITEITIRFENTEGSHRIICEDNGTGVEDYEKEMIFKLHYGKNTGQGLFLSREILQITGIKIKEIGVFGEGARFVLTCPKETIRLESN